MRRGCSGLQQQCVARDEQQRRSEERRCGRWAARRARARRAPARHSHIFDVSFEVFGVYNRTACRPAGLSLASCGLCSGSCAFECGKRGSGDVVILVNPGWVTNMPTGGGKPSGTHVTVRIKFPFTPFFSGASVAFGRGKTDKDICPKDGKLRSLNSSKHIFALRSAFMGDVAAPVTWRGNCWSPEEDQIILAVVSREGPKWGRVVLRLPWRTVPSIRNRWQRIENGRKLRESGVESKNRCHACGEPRRGHVCLAKLSGSTLGLGPGLPSAYHSHTPAPPQPVARLPAAGMQSHAMSPPSFGQSLTIGVAAPASIAEVGATHGATACSDVLASPSGVSGLGHGPSHNGATLTWPAASSSHAGSSSTHMDDGRCSSSTGPSAAAVLPVHFPRLSPPPRPSRPGGPGRPGSEHGESSAGPADAASAGVDGERSVSCEVGPRRSQS